MSLYRIAWNTDHGEWLEATHLHFLRQTVETLNALYGTGTHWIEERIVTRAAQMMTEAIFLAGEGP